jgi:UDP-glucose 4-epimerase
VSSIKVLCDEEDDRLLDEACAAKGTTLYGRSKLRLERLLMDALGGTATRLVIIRNPVMYGEDGRGESLLRLLRLADTPYPLPLARLHNRRSVLCVRNLASALSAVIKAPACPEGLYHVHDGPGVTTGEIVEAFREALRRPQRLFSVGDWVPLLARRFPAAAPAARRLYGSLELSDAHFPRTLGWSPVVETRVALRAMARGYAQAKKGREMRRLYLRGSR